MIIFPMMETDSEKETLNCAICNVEVTSEQNLENHILFDHEGKMPFMCSICNGAFASENVLKEHLVSVDCEELNLTDVLDFENRKSTLPLHEDNDKPVESFTTTYFRDKDFENVKYASLVHEEKKPLNTKFNCKDSGFGNRNVPLLDHEEKKALKNSIPAFSSVDENFKNGKTTLLFHEVKKPLQNTTSNVKRFCSLCSVNFEAITDFNDHLPCENERDYFKQTFYPTFIAPKVQIFSAVSSQNNPKACSICFDSAKCLCKIEVKPKVDNLNTKVPKKRCDSLAITTVHEAKKLRIERDFKPLDAKKIILEQAKVVEVENIPIKQNLKCSVCFTARSNCECNKISSKKSDSKDENSDQKVPKARLCQSSENDSTNFGSKIQVEKFQCEVCGHTFLRKLDMKEHVLEVHENKNLLKCLYCSLRYRGTISLNSHISKVHEGKKLFTYPDEDREIKCPFCNIYFRYPNGTFLKKHIQMHFKDISEFDYTSHGFLIPCSMCKEWFRHGLSSLMKHISEKHSESKSCSICSSKCLCKLKVDNSNSKIHKSPEITPVHEAKKLRIKSNVNLDAKIIILEQAKVVEIENIPTKESFQCSVCYTDRFYCECSKFSSKEMDSKNENSVPKVPKGRFLQSSVNDSEDSGPKIHEVEKFQCEVCGHNFLSKLDRKEHVLEVHDNKKRLSCLYCTLQFRGTIALNSHITKVHEGNKLFTYSEEHIKCPFCNLYFRGTPNILEKHIEMHFKDNCSSKGLPFPCSMCKESLKHGLSTLMRHISEKNHSAVKTCSICNEKVTSITDHIVAAHAKKNEKCPYCAQAFALKQEVKSHIRSVHEKNIYL